MLKKVAADSDATAFASIVLPFPGGPYRSKPAPSSPKVNVTVQIDQLLADIIIITYSSQENISKLCSTDLKNTSKLIYNVQIITGSVSQHNHVKIVIKRPTQGINC